MPRFLSRTSHLLFSLCAALATTHGIGADNPPQVTSFSPVGLQREAKQIQIRFSHDMVALGDDKAADAATVSCVGTAEKPSGHWQNPKVWVAEFASALPDGVACTVKPKALKTLAGETVGATAAWQFNTGGPRVSSQLLPREESNPVRYVSPFDNFAAFKPSVAADSATLRYLTCMVNGSPRLVQILEGNSRRDAYARLKSNSNYDDGLEADERWIVARCGKEPYPIGADISWVWHKRILSLHGVANPEESSFSSSVSKLVVSTLPAAIEPSARRISVGDYVATDLPHVMLNAPVATDLSPLRCNGHPVGILSAKQNVVADRQTHSSDKWMSVQCDLDQVNKPSGEGYRWQWQPQSDKTSASSNHAVAPDIQMLSHRSHGIDVALSEQAVMAFATSLPIDRKTLEFLRCRVDGRDTPVQVLQDQAQAKAMEILRARRPRDYAAFKPHEQHITVAQCGVQDLPNSSLVQWVWGPEIKTTNGLVNTDSRWFGRKVRPMLTVQATCGDFNLYECDPRKAVRYEFSELMPRADAGKFGLRGSSGKLYPAISDGNSGAWTRYYQVNGPFQQQEELTPEWADELQDISGRKLAEARAVKTARLPPDIGMTHTRGIFPVTGDRTNWEVTVRRVESTLSVRGYRFGLETNSTPTLLALIESAERYSYPFPSIRDEKVLDQAFPLSSAWLQAMEFEAPEAEDQIISIPTAEAAPLSIPISGKGTWMIELDSPSFRAAVRDKEKWPTFRKSSIDELTRQNLAIVQLTNLHLSAHFFPNSTSMIWVTALDTAKPVPSVSVEIWSCDRKRLASATSDELGRALFRPLVVPACKRADSSYDEDNYRDIWIVARSSDDVAVLRVRQERADDRRSDDKKRYRPDFSQQQPTLQAHTVLDRTLFQPGETVSMQHVLRLPTARGWELPAAGEGKLKIFNPLDELVLDEKISWQANGSVDAQWTIPAEAKLGYYQIKLEDATGQNLVSDGFSVEQYRIPMFKAQLIGKAIWQDGIRHVELHPMLAYTAGGAASGQKVTIRGKYEDAASRWRDVSWRNEIEVKDINDVKDVNDEIGRSYFDSGDIELPPFQPSDFDAVETVIDANGKASVVASVPNQNRDIWLKAEMRFTDGNGVAEQYTQSIYLPRQARGLGLLLARSSKPNWLTLAVKASESHDSRPLPDTLITIDIAAMALHGAGGKEPAVQITSPRRVLCSGKTDQSGIFRCEIPWSDQPGASGWLFRATADGIAAASMGINRKAFIWPPLQPQSTAEPALESKTKIWHEVLERRGTQAPKVGDMLTLHVRSPFLPATMLLTVEREGILDSRLYYLTKELEEITLSLEAHYAPNIVIAANLLQGTGENGTKSLKRHRATLTVLMDPATHQLGVKVSPAKAITRPGRPLNVQVKVTHKMTGKVAAGALVTLLAVDEGLLKLRQNGTWSLLNRFWRKRDAASDIRELYVNGAEYVWVVNPDNVRYSPSQHRSFGYGSPGPDDDGNEPLTVMGFRRSVQQSLKQKRNAGSNVEVVSVEDIGKMPDKGVAELLADAPSVPSEGVEFLRQRTNFSTLAHWQTDLVLDANGEATATLQMPDGLVNWRIVAIATLGTDRFGTGEATIKTAQPVQILSGLPPTVRSEDVLEQKFTVRNASDQPARLDVSAQAKATSSPDQPFAGLPKTPEVLMAQGLQLQQTLDLAAGESRVVQWPVTVPAGITQLDWTIEAREAGGNVDLGDLMVATQTVVPLVPVTVRESTLLQVDKPVSIPLAQPSDAISTAGGVTVRWQNSLLDGALQGARQWLQYYPYACMEQRSSKAVVSADPSHWGKVMATLPEHIDASGLVAYYPKLSGSETLTAYLLDLAESFQLTIPAKEKQRMQDGLRAVLAGRAPLDLMEKQYELAHRLHLQAAVPDLGKAKATVPSDLNQLPTVALVDWLRYLMKTPDTAERKLALHAASKALRQRYDIQGTRMVWRDRTDDNWWWYMWSQDTAVARTTLLAQQLAQIDPSWKTDVPLLIRGLIDRQRRGGWSTTVGNIWGIAALEYFAKHSEREPVSGTSSASFAGKSGKTDWPQAAAIHLPWPQQGARGELALSHEGTGAPWATVQIKAAVDSSKPISRGLMVRRSVSATSQRIPGKWSVGDVMHVRLDISADGDYSWLVVHDAIPSGATILDTTSSQLRNRNGYRSWWSPSFVERGSDSYRGYFARTWAGSWTAEYDVKLNNAGTFNLPPTHAEVMYAPEIFAETPSEGVTVLP